MIQKSKIYLKPQEKPPEGVRMQRGPKGGLYYEMKAKIAPIKEPDLKNLHTDEVIRRLPTLSQNELHSLITDNRGFVRSKIAERIDQAGLHMMLNDIDWDVRREIAKHINQTGLHKLMHDETFEVRRQVVDRIDINGLKEMTMDPEGHVANQAIVRLSKISRIDGMIKNYNKTGEIKLPSEIIKEISKIVKEESSSIEIIELIDEFYKHTPFGKFHQESKSDWEESSSSPLSGLLKDSILRQFGGKVRHHNAIKDWKKFTEELYVQYPKEMVDKYVQTHKKLTHKILDVIFPDQDEIVLFRGTTKNEAISEVKKNENVSLQANPLSSWTQRFQIAEKFASKENGIIVKTLAHKDNIWSTFMSHAYQGLEREFLIINPKNRQGTVMKC